jgi:hypothetical protein
VGLYEKIDLSHQGKNIKLRAFENRVLRRIFEPKTEEVAGGWRRLHNEELHNLYYLPDNIKVIKSRKMKWAGHIARIGEMRKNKILWVENLMGRDNSQDLVVDGKKILKSNSGK